MTSRQALPNMTDNQKNNNHKRAVHFAIMILLVVSSLAAPNPAAPSGSLPSLMIVEGTIPRLQQALLHDRVHCTELLSAYLQRIDAYDKSSAINAFIALNPQAMEQAQEIDARLREGRQLGRLFCVPLAVKDNYDVQGMATTAGSKALQNNFPPDNAFMIQRLMDEDAIVLGKTNMAEFACCASHSYSSMGGTVRNPYDRSLTTGGSSGGTAAALATSMALVGLGTDTGSSIRGPASHTSLVGLRPTMGRTSRDGIVPLSLERDIGGPMARTVQDAALLFSVMAGRDGRDPITLEAPGVPKTIALSPEALKGQGIGLLSGLAKMSLNGDIGDPRVLALFQQAISDMQKGGARMVHVDDMSVRTTYQQVHTCDTFLYDMDNYLHSTGAQASYASVFDLAQSHLYGPLVGYLFNEVQPDPVAPPSCMAAPAGDINQNPGMAALRQQLVETMDRFGLAALAFPTYNVPPQPLDIPGDPPNNTGNNNYLAPFSGLPAISVPMGFVDGKPVGMQLLGRPFKEPLLLNLAYAYEHRTNHRKPPTGFPPVWR